MLSVKKSMSLACTSRGLSSQSNAFELFGFDFLIDEDFRTWLIEVNTNPYLGTPNEYMEKLVP